VTQRGNGRQQAFFGDEDHALYQDLLAEHARRRCLGLDLSGNAEPRAPDPGAEGAKSGQSLRALKRSPHSELNALSPIQMHRVTI
jgi:hypothetical protein